jgi:hypothetical protein
MRQENIKKYKWRSESRRTYSIYEKYMREKDGKADRRRKKGVREGW